MRSKAERAEAERRLSQLRAQEQLPEPEEERRSFGVVEDDDDAFVPLFSWFDD